MTSTELRKIFDAHYTYCVEWLVKNMNCPEADAQDLFMDAIIKLSLELEKENFAQTNIRGWLITVVRNAYINKFNKKKSYKFIDIDVAEAIIGKEKGLYNDDFNPMIVSEILQEHEQQERQKVVAFLWGFEQLGKPCQRLLNGLVTGRKLKDLQDELGYGSYDSLKNTKSRCMKKLREFAAQWLEKEKVK